MKGPTVFANISVKLTKPKSCKEIIKQYPILENNSKDMNNLKKKDFSRVSGVERNPTLKDVGFYFTDPAPLGKPVSVKTKSKSFHVKGEPKKQLPMRLLDENSSGFRNAERISKKNNEYKVRIEIPNDYGAIEGYIPKGRAKPMGGGGRPPNTQLSVVEQTLNEEEQSNLPVTEIKKMYQETLQKVEEFPRSDTGESSSTPKKNEPPSEKRMNEIREHVNFSWPNRPKFVKEMAALALAHGADHHTVSGPWYMQRLTNYMAKHNIPLPKKK